jgi:PAS domain S-box-containing protein
VLKDDTVAGATPPRREEEAARLEALEASLRRQERELAEAYRIARLGTWRWIVDSDEVVWSEEVYSAFGLTPGEPTPDYAVIRALHTPESAARLEELVGRALSHGESYTHDMELLLPDGTGRWIASRGEVGARAADGRVTELRGTIQDITERKRTEMALLQRERELVEAQRIGRLGTFRWLKKDGRVVWSEAVYRMFGVDPSRPVPRGEETAALMTVESWERISKATYEALETGLPYSMDLELLERDGAGRRWVTVRGEGLRGADGEVVELTGTVQDVTDRRRVEEALRESQSRFQKLYDSDLVGIGFPDASGAIHEANDVLLRIVGYTREDMKAGLVRWDTMTPPEYRELDLLHLAEAAERGSCTPYEKEYIRKDGSRVPILCGFARLAGAQLGGERLGAIGFVMDLSAQKAAERKVRERELQFQELAESLPQLVWASDTNGDRVYTNRRYMEYTGIPEEGLMGGRWRELLHPADLERTNRLWAHSMATGEPYQNEYRIRRHDGVYRSFLVRGVAMRNVEGEIERWLGSATDIHDQKLAEEAVRRTEKLAAAGRLAATIAHEINNPLAAVTNALYLALMDDGLKDETRAYLNMAEQELARAAHVTAQTLQFHRQTTTPGEANVGEIMESAMALFATRFRSSGVAVEREYAVERRLYCCADELRQVFANLLSNALDATRHGGRLRLRIREWAGDVAGVRVTLGDTGSGIPAEVMGRIFEPFLSTKEATGTGLGLWVSEGIVRKHQGTIRVKSQAGRGTVFVVFLPWDGVGR